MYCLPYRSVWVACGFVILGHLSLLLPLRLLGVVQPLVNCILHQQGTFNTDIIVCQCQAKAEFVVLKCEHQSTSASELKSALPAVYMLLRLVPLPG